MVEGMELHEIKNGLARYFRSLAEQAENADNPKDVADILAKNARQAGTLQLAAFRYERGADNDLVRVVSSLEVESVQELEPTSTELVVEEITAPEANSSNKWFSVPKLT